MQLGGEAQVRCGKCGAVAYIPGSSLYVEATWSHERQMGQEVGYDGTTEIGCANCGHDISVIYEATEYPVGALNFSETTVEGGSLLHGFSDIEFHFDDDPHFDDDIYSFEREIGLYLPEERKIITGLESGTESLIRAISLDPELVRRIASRDFEELIAHIFGKEGFVVDLTKQTRDGGRDIIAIRSDLGIRSKFIIECKRYSAANPVTVELVRNLYGVQKQEGANKSVLVTTSYFTSDARKFASATNTTDWGMDLRDYDEVIKWIRGNRV